MIKSSLFYITHKTVANKAVFYYFMLQVQNYDVNVETTIQIKTVSHLVVIKLVNNTCITKN